MQHDPTYCDFWDRMEAINIALITLTSPTVAQLGTGVELIAHEDKFRVLLCLGKYMTHRKHQAGHIKVGKENIEQKHPGIARCV